MNLMSGIEDILGDNLKRASIIVLTGSKQGQKIDVMFNPSQYVLTDTAKYTEAPAVWKDNPFLNYKGGQASTLNMELFFDTGEAQVYGELFSRKATDVSIEVGKFTELVYIDSNLYEPPRVQFTWGQLSFQGVVTSVKSTYTRFTESGMPTQAKISVTFKAAPIKDSKRANPFYSPDRTKCQMVREDCSIWDIAWKEYGDMSRWKLIAKANGITNPLEIPPGTMLKITAL